MKQRTKKTSQIDWYKATLGLIILLFGSLLMATTLIVPLIRDINKQNVALSVEKTSHDRAKARYDEEFQALNNFKAENNKTIASFHYKFDQATFENRFKDALLLEFKQTASGEDRDYEYTDYNVTAGFSTPKRFFDLIKSFDSSYYITQVTYPLVFASQNSNGVYSAFGIRTYTLINGGSKRKPLVEEGQAIVPQQNSHAPDNAAHEAPKEHSAAEEKPKDEHKPAEKKAEHH